VIDKGLKSGMAVLYADRQHAPHPLAPAAASLAARPLGDLAVDGYKPHPLFHGVVGWLDARHLEEGGYVPCSRNRSWMF
jgi:hypothetical protein